MKYRELSSIFYSDNSKYLKIYENRYNSESTYRFNIKINGYNAFLVINHDILQRIETIMELDCNLLKRMNSLPKIALKQYTKKCLIDEIKMTNEIEGVASTRKEINEILNDKVNNKKRKLYGLVKKYELLKEEHINLFDCKDIRKLYDELVLKEVIEEEPKNQPDGSIFRANEVYVQNSYGKIIHKGVYPESEIIDFMNNALSILNNDDYNFLIRIAVFHYIFGYIHPFYDGNGRMSRFISSYLLSQKLQYLVSYKISNTIKENISSYDKSFKEANDEKNRGELTIFVIKFFDIIIKSLEDLCQSLDEGYNKLNFFKDKIIEHYANKDKKSEILYILVQNTLFGEEGLSVEELYSVSSLGKSKIRTFLRELENEGILYVTKYGKKNLYDVNLNSMSNLNATI